ncbi:MAG: nucleotidyl transferase AbiEii/AbiGii toxin family protein [Propionibacteriaceae bacterium]|nr:nucleotidyl transferase AbiEii/AbiGii toxin family protein [Propionibacteriaceae bacterium]
MKLGVRGKTWRRVQVEVSFPEGGIGVQTVPLPAPTVDYFGVTTPDQIVAIAMDYQVAQKMHAASDPDIPPDIINDRVRDIVDLVLIQRHFYADDPTPASLRAACLDVFDARAEEAGAIGKTPRLWPPAFVPNATWEKAYPKLAAEVDLTLGLDETISLVQEWVAQIGRG